MIRNLNHFFFGPSYIAPYSCKKIIAEIDLAIDDAIILRFITKDQ
jgi:hypothetical protein